MFLCNDNMLRSINSKVTYQFILIMHTKLFGSIYHYQIQLYFIDNYSVTLPTILCAKC